MKKPRKHYTPEEKVAVLRRHLLENEPISKLCDELGLQLRSSTDGRRSSSLAGRQQEIHAERDRKLEEARNRRQIRRQQPLDVQPMSVGRGSE